MQACPLYCFSSEDFGRRTSLGPIGLVCRRWVGKNFGWVAARPQPKRRINCETPFACETIHFAISWGPLPLYFTQKTHTKTQNQTFPDLPEWVRTADAGRTTQPLAETQIYLTGLWVGGVGKTFFGSLRSQLWLSRSESVPISPFFPTMFLGALPY